MLALIQEQADSISREMVPEEAENRCLQIVQQQYTTSEEHVGLFREGVRRQFRSLRNDASGREEEFEIQEEWILEHTNTCTQACPSPLAVHPIFQMGPQQLGSLVPELALEIVKQLGRDREFQSLTEGRRHEREMIHEQKEMLRMQMLREERQQEHERTVHTKDRRLPIASVGANGTTAGRHGTPPLWSDTVLRQGWYGDRYVSLSAAYYDARPAAERDTPPEVLCDRLADRARTPEPPAGLVDALERPIEVVTEDGRSRSLSLLYVPRRGRPDVRTRARGLWGPLEAPHDDSMGPRPPENSVLVPPAAKRRRRGTGAEEEERRHSLCDAVLAPFPREAHHRLRALLFDHFVDAPALAHWKGTVWERVAGSDPEDVRSRLDLSTHPLVPALVEWLRRCLGHAAGAPPPPAPTFPPATGSVSPTRTTEEEGPLDVWACWTALGNGPTQRTLSELLHRHRCPPPGPSTAPPPESAYLLKPLEPERMDFLHAAGQWLPYHELATVLGWTGPLRKAFHLVPLLAKGLLGTDRLPDEAWRDPAARPLRYRWQRCLGAWRRAAVLHDVLQATPGLPLDRVSMELNRRAGF